MYKYLLCWRYLKTKYIALASVISVMLGVATMIVVNSVMAGFAEKMRDRLHGLEVEPETGRYLLCARHCSLLSSDAVPAVAPDAKRPSR